MLRPFHGVRNSPWDSTPLRCTYLSASMLQVGSVSGSLWDQCLRAHPSLLNASFSSGVTMYRDPCRRLSPDPIDPTADLAQTQPLERIVGACIFRGNTQIRIRPQTIRQRPTEFPLLGRGCESVRPTAFTSATMRSSRRAGQAHPCPAAVHPHLRAPQGLSVKATWTRRASKRPPGAISGKEDQYQYSDPVNRLLGRWVNGTGARGMHAQLCQYVFPPHLDGQIPPTSPGR
jgi:hypothetical protein